MVLDHVHISHVSKLGSSIPCVNLPPVKTCNPSAPCYQKCYARKGRFRFKRNVELLEKNLFIYRMDPGFYEREVMIAAAPCKFFRWHSSGDIPDMEYLKMMIRIAHRIPDTRFLCFTKQYDMINSCLSAGLSIPDNLTMVMSVWGEFGLDYDSNPFNLPQAFIKFKSGITTIPDYARKCSGFCGDCIASSQSCWDLKYGQAVYFNEH